MIFNLIFIVLILFFSSYFIGRGWINELPLKIEEKFGLSFGISIIWMYLLGFAIFIFHLPQVAYVLYLLLLTLTSIIKLRQKLDDFRENVFYLFGFFLIFLVLISIQGVLPVYSGSLWYFDWWEHWERSRFFLENFPLITKIGPYLLTARPPLFNVVSAYGLNFFGENFWSYQIISTLLNSLVILPCWLLVNHFTKYKYPKKTFFIVLFFLLFNPAFIIETTFTWTKNLSYYFLLSGFYLYLQFLTRKIRSYLYLSALFLASAILTHYSVIPYVGMMAVDFLIKFFWNRQIKLKHLINWSSLIILFCAIWFIWASSNFGVYQTFLGNTAFEWQKNFTFSQRLIKDVSNFKKSILPILSPQYLQIIGQQKNPVVILYDSLYAIYANTLSGQISITLSLVLFIWLSKYLLVFFTKLFLSFRGVRPEKSSKAKLILAKRQYASRYLSANWSDRYDGKYFWKLKWFLNNTLHGKNFTSILVFGLGGFISMFTIPNLETTGFAQVTLIPVSLYLICLAVTKVISLSLYKKYRLVKLIIIGLGVEVVFGIFLRIWVSRYDLNPDYLVKYNRGNDIQYLLPVHINNYTLKQDNNLVFLSDKFVANSPIFQGLILIGYIGGIIYLIRALWVNNRKNS